MFRLIGGFVFLFVLMSWLHLPAWSAGRINSNTLSCSGARLLVAQKGAVLMQTGRHTFDRYVRGIGYCAPGEYVDRAFVPTLDRPKCAIGYVCTPDNPLEFITDPLRKN